MYEDWMETSTIKAIKTLADADPVKTLAQRGQILEALGLLMISETMTTSGQVDGPRIVSFAEAAQRLAASKRNVHQLCASGYLTKISLPDRKQARGVTLESLNNLLAAGTVSGG